MMVIFATIGFSYIILAERITSDFGKECETKTGQAYIIDQLYV